MDHTKSDVSGLIQRFRAFWARRLPESLRRLMGKYIHTGPYRGDFNSWHTATGAATGYDASIILWKAIEAARAVRDGHALWERDTVLFQEQVYHRPLLDGLLNAARDTGDRLRVLDFGGALGSTWWQHRSMLSGLSELKWGIVEQPGFVDAGRREFEFGPLCYFHSVDECVTAIRPNVALLSGVLAYLEHPFAVLSDFAGREFDYIILDRVGLSKVGRTRLTVQHVPTSIYPASYPCWFFDRDQLLEPLKHRWRIISEWPTFDEGGNWYEFRGILFERIVPDSGES